jgi:hypothetical protein
MTEFVQNPVRTETTTALEASAAAAQRSGMRVTQIYSDIQAERTLPRGIDVQQQAAFQPVRNAHSNAGTIFAFADGRVWGPDGTIVSRDRSLIGNLSPVIRMSADAHPIFRRPIFQKPRHIQGRVAVVTGPSPDNLSHWLFGVLPRLCLLNTWNSGFSDIEWVITPRVHTSFQVECLERYGVSRAKLIEASTETFVEASEIVAPSFVSPAFVAPSWFLEDLRRRFADVAPASGAPRLYVSRRDAPGRRVNNEEGLRSLLESRGFVVMQFERIPFLDQIALAKGADVIVSAHGAGLSHLAFAKPGAGVIELFAPNYINPMYWCLADELRLRYRCCIGQSSRPSDSRDLVRQDIDVNLDAFRRTLDDLVEN